MNKVLPLIEQLILRSFPEVYDVSFKVKKVYLGSSPELPEEERSIDVTVIIVTFNNLKGEYSLSYLWDKRSEVIYKVSSYFNINHTRYGAKWDFDFYEVKKVPLRY